jgi:hypothetical protein
LWQRQQNGENVSIELLAILANKLGINSELLLDTMLLSPTFGLLVEKIGQYQLQNTKLFQNNSQFVEIERAIADLRHLVNNFQHFQKKRSIEEVKKQQISFPTDKPNCCLDRRSLNSLEQIQPILLFPQSF